jgi:DNA-binding LacI/PurR family transcriptional regulator
MTRLRVLTVIDQTEQDLLRRLAQGEWKGDLPAFKQLAPLLGISVPTLGRAVKRLVRRGVLLSRGARRPFGINAKALPAVAAKAAPLAAAPAHKGRLLLILPRSLDYFYGWPAALFLELSLTMVREGWHFDIALVDPSKPPVALRALDRLVARHKPTHVLLASTPPAYCEWARRTSAPAVAFLGGEPEAAGEVPIIGANAELPARLILEKFKALGHRRVLLALGNMQARTIERFVKAHATVFGGSREQLEADHLLFAVAAPLPSREEKQVIKDALRRSGATAVLSSGVARYFLLLDAARELGREIPRDLSIALMSQDTVFKDLPLIPAHVKAPPALFIREVHVWLRSRQPDTYALASRLMRHWEPGDTLAKAPKGAHFG